MLKHILTILLIIIGKIVCADVESVFISVEKRVESSGNVTSQESMKYTYESGYKRLWIAMSDLENVSYAFVSDYGLFKDVNNEEKMLKRCMNSSGLFCTFIDSTTKNFNFTILDCVKSVYVYVSKKVDATNFKLNISSGFDSNNNLSCLSKPTNNYSVCAVNTIEQCKLCLKDCVYSSCLMATGNNTPPEIVKEACLPLYPSSDSWLERECNSGQYSKNESTAKAIFTFQRKDKCTIIDRIIAQKPKNPIVIILIVLLIVLILIAMFYRWRLKATGNPPFPVCNFCPDFLFPKIYFVEQKNEMATL